MLDAGYNYKNYMLFYQLKYKLVKIGEVSNTG